jgi:hypothetical protein
MVRDGAAGATIGDRVPHSVMDGRDMRLLADEVRARA